MAEIRHRKRTSQTPDQFELPTYSSAPITTSRDGLFKPTTVTETPFPDPEYTRKTLSSSPDFQCLIVHNTDWVNLSLIPARDPTSNPKFHISNSQFSPSKPSVVVRCPGKTGEVRGVLNLLWGRDNVFALGDPDASLVGTGLAWENMRRTSNWTHATYEFEYAVAGVRRVFVWQRTRQAIFSDQPDLELREKGEQRVLASYKGCQGLVSRRRGEFYVRRAQRVGRDGGADGGEVWGDWEVVVLLTCFGIVEGSRRRARQRRSGGGGG